MRRVAAYGLVALVGCTPGTDAAPLTAVPAIAGRGSIPEPGGCKLPVSGTATGPSGGLQGPTVEAETPPPPISGGTLLTTQDGSTVVAADPDRDQLHFVDATGMRALHTRELHPGDEPGRVVEDAQGRIHVVLRGARAIASLGREPDSAITRREVCDVPRGIAYDAARDQLHVACAEGKLVTLGAAPSAGITRSLDVATDLRDVLVHGEQLYVTRFRSAELLVLDADGQVRDTRKPVTFRGTETRTRPDAACTGATGRESTQIVTLESTPNVAWRAIDVPKRGVVMLHQRSRTEEIQVTTQGGYGSGSCGGGVVQSAVTIGLDQQVAYSADFGDITLGVDVASDRAGTLLAVVAPGNHAAGMQQVMLTSLGFLDVPAVAAQPLSADAGVPAQQPGSNPFVPIPPTAAVDGEDAIGDRSKKLCFGDGLLGEGPGQATAAAFTAPHVLAVQEREPAAISFYDLSGNVMTKRVVLGSETRRDTGHELFHMRTGAGLACASCHPEGGDDGHTWNFQTIGRRRTQTLRGGILGTEPLHWNGDMADFSMLMKEVFQGRMSGFAPSTDQADALSRWIDRQPALHAEAADAAAAERGRVLFESAEVGCNQCHTGSHLTNNTMQNVGTGADLQVPSLKGVRFRTPLMHDGCAATLAERFTDPRCGGGDSHGKTSQLDPQQVNDLAAYLETL